MQEMETREAVSGRKQLRNSRARGDCEIESEDCTNGESVPNAPDAPNVTPTPIVLSLSRLCAAQRGR
jgi:hypothetical protein